MKKFPGYFKKLKLYDLEQMLAIVGFVEFFFLRHLRVTLMLINFIEGV